MLEFVLKDLDYLKTHFKEWYLTEKCRKTFNHILKRIISFKLSDHVEEIMNDTWPQGTLTIELQSEENNEDSKW